MKDKWVNELGEKPEAFDEVLRRLEATGLVTLGRTRETVRLTEAGRGLLRKLKGGS